MTSKQPDSIVVLDKSSRRRFIRSSSGLLLAGAAIAMSGSSLAADCDRGGSRSSASDQDEGTQADQKQCESRNIVSQHEPVRVTPVTVKTIKS